jgi:hypothetical protein
VAHKSTARPYHARLSLAIFALGMYCNPRCKIVNNDYSSESITLSRGVKQGCPLSAYLFIMAIEMLDIKIRSNNNIKKSRA